MSSTLWLLLYLAPLLGLTAAVFAWFGWLWRGSGLHQRIHDLETQVADTQNALRTAESERAAAHSKVITATADANTLREQTENELHTLREDWQAAQTETRHREDELARLRREFEILRSERDLLRAQPITQEIASGATPLETAAPAKPRRKRATPAKVRPIAAVPASLHEKIAALVSDLTQHQSSLATLKQERDDWQRRVIQLEANSPADPAGHGLARRSLADSEKRLRAATTAIERLENQARALHRSHEKAAALAQVADDDLTQIKGIKRIIGEQLRTHGIRTWRQIAQWDNDELRAFSELLAFKNRATREQWQEQARTLHEAAHGPLP